MTKLERILYNLPPVAYIRDESKKTTFPGFQGLALYDVFDALMAQISTQGLSIRAASIAFNLVMAIPAITLFLCILIPFVPGSQEVYRELLRIIKEFTPDKDTQQILTQFLNDFFNKKPTGIVSIGFLLVIFTSSNAMMGIIRSFDRSLSETKKSNFIKKRLRAIRLMSTLIGFLIATILLSVGQGVLFNKIMDWADIKNEAVRELIQHSRLLVSLFLFVYAIGYIYKYAPSYATAGRKILSPGAVIAAVLMLVITLLFSYWAQNISNYNKLYGSIGSLLILMLLIFLNSLMLLIGYEINLSIHTLANKKRAQKAKQGR